MTTPKRAYQANDGPVVLRLPDVLGYCGLGPTVLKEMVAEGRFPKPFKLSENGRAVAWLRSEVEEWLKSRVKARDEAPKPRARAAR